MSTASKDEDPAFSLAFLLVFLGVVMWLIWHFFHDQIMEGMRYVRLAELLPLMLFDHRATACFAWLKDAHVGIAAPTAAILEKAVACFGYDRLRGMPTAEALEYYNVTPTSLGAIMAYISYYAHWLIGALLAMICIYTGYVTPRNRFLTRHTLESFIKTQAAMWPVIAPIVNFNPSKTSRVPGSSVPDKLPLFAEALSPEEWLAWHAIPVANGIPNKERIRRAFLEQLGPRWAGLDDKMPKYMQCLFAALALQGVQKRDACDQMLGRFATHWSPEHGFQPSLELMVEVRKILHDPKIGGKAAEVAARHAYRTTAFLGLLKWARFMGGVVAPAQFLWLRAVDRNFWYPLNNLGRRSFHTEGAGAIAHFMAEEAAGKPLPMPRIDTAIITMNQYLANHADCKIPAREAPRAPKKALVKI